MPVDVAFFEQITARCQATGATLVAVSKTKPAADIMALYELGQRHFGENYVQELVEKADQLPPDICWHFIGHLQSNKVKYIAPFVHLIHGIDSIKLLNEVEKQGKKLGRRVGCLLQLHIAQESTKFGFDPSEVKGIDLTQWPHAEVRGLMGMASFSNSEPQVRQEFLQLKQSFVDLKAHYTQLDTLSMGMSGDYNLALDCGSNMLRIGSLLFGSRG
ncbi:MAG: YggS family pyridoxal phosphate-dependent enzyme [Bacteroidetes bacterium]|nr:MAG: YggS family pyridoxal phosphate-dependent enzyme [Bacteroidota bacterium]